MMTEKSLVAILAMFSLSVCTIDVNTASILGSDDEVIPSERATNSRTHNTRGSNLA